MIKIIEKTGKRYIVRKNLRKILGGKIMTKKIKLGNGKEVELRLPKWKEAKKLGLMSLLMKMATEPDKVDDEEMDKVVSALIPAEVYDELDLRDVMKIYEAFGELMTEKKK